MSEGFEGSSIRSSEARLVFMLDNPTAPSGVSHRSHGSCFRWRRGSVEESIRNQFPLFSPYVASNPALLPDLPAHPCIFLTSGLACRGDPARVRGPLKIIIIMQSLYTTLLTTEELTTAAARLAPIWTTLFAGQSLLLAVAAAAETHREAIVKAASRKTVSDFTDSLADSDAARDAAFTTLRDLSGTWAKNPSATPDQRVAAARLEDTFARHGNSIIHLGYNRESGIMNELIADLKSPQSTVDLAALNFAPLFAALVSAQAGFEDLMADKAATKGGELLPTVAEHRPALVRQVNLLLAVIAEWQAVASTPELEAAIGKMDEVIVQIATPALSRRTRANAEPQPPAPTP